MKADTFIIAEAGVNHNGSLDLAKKMVDVAAHSGADAIKFQSFKAEHLVCKNAPLAPYQHCSNDSGISQFEMLKNFELSESQLEDVLSYCQKKKNNVSILTIRSSKY